MRTLRVVWPWVLLVVAGLAIAAPVGTGFTYQGELKFQGAPATGEFDFEFALYNVVAAGTPIDTVSRDNAAVANGLFTVELDYTGVPFEAAQQYFLEVRVRAGASTGVFQPLLPRQKITPTPYAVNARTVQAGGVTQGAIAAGAVGTAQLQGNAVDTTQISNLAVTDAKIANGTITAAKLAFTAGDVTGVAAGAGLTGGGASGDLGLAVDTNAVQARITGTCAIGEYFRGIAGDGSVLCESVLSYLGINLFTAVDDPENVVGEHTAIAIGSDGLPIISYYDASAAALRVAKCVNAACTGTSIVTTVDGGGGNDVGHSTSIAIGSDTLPVISYRDRTRFALMVAKCSTTDCTGTATITTIDNPANFVGEYTSIAVGSDGLPVISYYDATAMDLKVAKCTSPDCTGTTTITIVDSSNMVGEFSSIAVGLDGLPIISYHDRSVGVLKAAKCATPNCAGGITRTFVDDPANNVGQFTSIAIGSDGLPVISYHDLTATSLKVAKCVNAACSGANTAIRTTLDDPVNVVGYYSSIEVGTDGIPVIAYYDETARTLKVARCTNSSCTGVPTIKTLVSPIAGFTSLALGSDGLPVIAYFDNIASTLNVAKCGTRGCR